MAKDPIDLEAWRTPPVWELSSAGMLLQGNHVNKVWRGMAHPIDDTAPGLAMIIKWMRNPVALATELACSLAGQALKLQVPAGRLVIADGSQLQGIPAEFESRRVICFGSQMQFPDDLPVFARSDEAAKEFVWSKLCDAPQGASGAGWDELVANEDRHHENVLFDGVRWWLFDHERALEPIAEVMRRYADLTVRQALIDYRVGRNQLASQMIQRRPRDHGLGDVPATLMAARKRMQWLVNAAQKWKTGDSEVDGTLNIAEVVLRSIDLRLPALALHLQARLQQPQGKSLWDSTD